MDYIRHIGSPLGPLTLASDGESLTGLWFDGQKHYGMTLAEEREEKDLRVFRETEAWLRLYFSGEAPDFTPPLLLRGTDFRRRIWQLLLAVPYGETVSYGELARRAAGDVPAAFRCARAVGGAVGRNPISILVPCHRVLAADGSLCGYAGGAERKRALLRLEGIEIP